MAALQKDEIREVFKKKYPGVFKFGKKKGNRDFLYFLANEIVDLKILVETSQASEDVPLRPKPQSQPGSSQPISRRSLGQSGETKYLPSAYEMVWYTHWQEAN